MLGLIKINLLKLHIKFLHPLMNNAKNAERLIIFSRSVHIHMQYLSHLYTQSSFFSHYNEQNLFL